MRKKTIVAVNNVYSLMQYLLLRTDEVGSTLFVFDSMPDAIQRRFAPLRPLTTGTKWNKAFYIPLRLHLAALVARQTPVYISYPAYCCNLLLDLFPNAFYIEEGAGDYCDREVGLAPPPPDRRWDRRLRFGILYIGIGRYDFFWKDFYLSAERYFFQHPGYSRHYYVFSDSPALYGEADNPRIHRLHQPNLGWPDNTMKRFHMFLRIGARLQEETDYLFFFNANMEFKQPVGSEILPTKADKEGLVAGIHPGYYRLRKWKWTYERRPASACYVPFYQGRHYFQGTLWGGRTEAVVRLCEACRQMIDSDVAKGLIPVWHDESAMNRYFIDHPPKALDCSYNYAEGHVLPGCDVKILSRDKERYFTFRQLGRSSYKESAQMPRAWRAYEQTMAFLFESRAGCWLLNKLKI